MHHINYEEHVGPCFHEISVPDAIRMGALAPLRTLVVKANVDLSNVELKPNGRYDVVQMTTALAKSSAVIGAIQLHRKCFNGQSAIAFCGTIAFAKKAAEDFVSAGIKAAHISGATPAAEQERILSAYATGAIEVICSADLLIEGFDNVRAQVCYNLVETQSIVEAEQRGGRVARLDPNNACKIGKVVDFKYHDERRRNPPIH